VLAEARHVRACDEAVHIGASAPRDSYLRWERILEAAKATGAQAVHPGYGFLSENEDFAQACADAGLVFIGPPPSAIRDMGSKAAAKALMEKAGVPLVPGYHGADNDPALLAREAARIGYPVLIKASAGGGGKGMRRVDRPEDFAAALAANTGTINETASSTDDMQQKFDLLKNKVMLAAEGLFDVEPFDEQRVALLQQPLQHVDPGSHHQFAAALERAGHRFDAATVIG
jgi:acetyl/propionyl-CoA carboxylase alpha subunit